MKPMTSLFILVWLTMIASVPGFAQALEPQSWVSPHFRQHPLAGTVWNGDGRPSDWSNLADRVKRAKYVFVGEIHPNPDHHLIQAAVIRWLTANGRQPAIVWEMIPRAQQRVLGAIDHGNRDAAKLLGQQLTWGTSGWPDWRLYLPIAAMAIKHKLPMHGAALSRKHIRSLAKDGVNGMAHHQRDQLHLAFPLPEQHNRSMLQLLFEGHCQLIPQPALAPMQLVQRARDGAMAETVVGADDSAKDPKHGAVLIAGNGHVRNDWAAPAIVARMRPQASLLTIAQLEVDPQMTNIADYLDLSDGMPVYDLLVLTPKSEIRDHCAELKKQFKR